MAELLQVHPSRRCANCAHVDAEFGCLQMVYLADGSKKPDNFACHEHQTAGEFRLDMHRAGVAAIVPVVMRPPLLHPHVPRFASNGAATPCACSVDAARAFPQPSNHEESMNEEDQQVPQGAEPVGAVANVTNMPGYSAPGAAYGSPAGGGYASLGKEPVAWLTEEKSAAVDTDAPATN